MARLRQFVLLVSLAFALWAPLAFRLVSVPLLSSYPEAFDAAVWAVRCIS